MAVNIRLIQLYVDVINKVIVSVQGSPTAVPALYYGDKPTFQIFPVTPGITGVAAGPFSGGQYVPASLAGYTMNITLGPAPNAEVPNASYASLDSIAWDATTSSFIGTMDLTQSGVEDFIGMASSGAAWFNLDVFDATLNRTTIYQTTSASVVVWASIDAPATGPAGPAVQYVTLAQALGIFVQIGPNPNKFIEFAYAGGVKVFSCNADGTQSWT
jgi:hypothetical protein